MSSRGERLTLNPPSWCAVFVPPDGLSSNPNAFAKSMFAAPPTRPIFLRNDMAALSPLLLPPPLPLSLKLPPMSSSSSVVEAWEGAATIQ